MKLLFVLLATVAFAVAKPFDGTIAGCKLEVFKVSEKSCRRQFGATSTWNKLSPCRAKYVSFVKCYKGKIQDVYRKARKDLQETISRCYEPKLKSMQGPWCGKNCSPVKKYFLNMSMKGACPKGTVYRLLNCPKEWYKIFSGDRRDTNLCSEYEHYRTCIDQIMRGCNSYRSFIINNQWVTSKESNPFCWKP